MILEAYSKGDSGRHRFLPSSFVVVVVFLCFVLFFPGGETEPARRSSFPKAAEKFGSFMAVRTKGNVISGTTAIYHTHS